jgi:hypothetical protein
VAGGKGETGNFPNTPAPRGFNEGGYGEAMGMGGFGATPEQGQGFEHPEAPTPTPTLHVEVVIEPDPCGLIEYNGHVIAEFSRDNPALIGGRFNG